MTIQPIETIYKGYRFRSRLEARWAVFFDELKIRFEYEKEGYRLDSGPYLPDFWLPEYETWLEVKPEGEECPHAYNLQMATDCPVIVTSGLPENPMKLFCCDLSNSGGGFTEWVGQWAWENKAGRVVIAVKTHGSVICRNSSMKRWDLVRDVSECIPGFIVGLAYLSAKQARSEHEYRETA